MEVLKKILLLRSCFFQSTVHPLDRSSHGRVKQEPLLPNLSHALDVRGRNASQRELYLKIPEVAQLQLTSTSMHAGHALLKSFRAFQGQQLFDRPFGEAVSSSHAGSIENRGNEFTVPLLTGSTAEEVLLTATNKPAVVLLVKILEPDQAYGSSRLHGVDLSSPSSSSPPQSAPSVSSNDELSKGKELEEDDYSTEGEIKRRLVPVYITASAKDYFRIKKCNQYVKILSEMMKKDPLLIFVLQKAIRQLKLESSKSIAHIASERQPESSHNGIRITPCAWQNSQSIVEPALIIEHNLPYSVGDVAPRIVMDYSILSQVPYIITILDFNGAVLYQNAMSMNYLGDMGDQSFSFTNNRDFNILEHMFHYEPEEAEFMMEEMNAGGSWTKVLKVPASVKRLIAQLATAKEQQLQKKEPSLEETEDKFVGNEIELASRHSSFQSAGQPDLESARTPKTPDLSPLRGMPKKTLTFKARLPTLSHRQSRFGQAGNVSTVKYASMREGGGSVHQVSRRMNSNLSVRNTSIREHTDSDCGWHEISARPLWDPVLKEQVIMICHSDATQKVEVERRLARLTEAQLSMLEQFFPRHVIDYMLTHNPRNLTQDLKQLSETHKQVAVLFADIVSFTSMCEKVEASAVMNFLNDLYTVFDMLVDDYGVYKLETIGDCYIVAGGLMKHDRNGFHFTQEVDAAANAKAVFEFAKAMLEECKFVCMPHNNQPVVMRVGIHTGDLVSGLIGTKVPKFSLFGDTMNTASRMESTCRPGCIHVSESMQKLLPQYNWQPTGGVDVKGKGHMETFLWIPPVVEDIPQEPESEMDPNQSIRSEFMDMENRQLSSSVPSLRTSRTSRVSHFSQNTNRSHVRSPPESSTRSSRSLRSNRSRRNSGAFTTILMNLQGSADGGELEEWDEPYSHYSQMEQL